MTLAEVAIACGFHDQPHFTRAFERVFRMTPARYLRRR
jgi:transcriptional regulator GlxA family with amidase domain